jgi:hypothetical protein
MPDTHLLAIHQDRASGKLDPTRQAEMQSSHRSLPPFSSPHSSQVVAPQLEHGLAAKTSVSPLSGW